MLGFSYFQIMQVLGVGFFGVSFNVSFMYHIYGLFDCALFVACAPLQFK